MRLAEGKGNARVRFSLSLSEVVGHFFSLPFVARTNRVRVFTAASVVNVSNFLFITHFWYCCVSVVVDLLLL